jgi:hypothetical protein
LRAPKVERSLAILTRRGSKPSPAAEAFQLLLDAKQPRA